MNSFLALVVNKRSRPVNTFFIEASKKHMPGRHQHQATVSCFATEDAKHGGNSPHTRYNPSRGIQFSHEAFNLAATCVLSAAKLASSVRSNALLIIKKKRREQ
jgi:hypothetical protein